jgi:hypothetical protein
MTGNDRRTFGFQRRRAIDGLQYHSASEVNPTFCYPGAAKLLDFPPLLLIFKQFI